MDHKRPAFTLLELTMALVITAVTGLSIAGVTLSISHVSQRSRQFNESIQSGRCVLRNIGLDIRQAKLVTACDDLGVTLWANDDDQNGLINFSELMAIYYDPEAKQLCQTRIDLSSIDQGARDAINQPVLLSNLTSASYSRSYIRTSSYTLNRVLAQNVTAARFFVDEAAPTSRTLGVELTITRDDQPVVFRTAVSTRAGFEQYVGVSDGDYVLLPVY